MKKKILIRRVLIVSIALLLIFALVFLFKMISKPVKEKFSGVKGNVVCANKKEIVATANILSTGDLLMHGPLLTAFYDENTKSYNFEKIFTYLSLYTKKADFCVINMEGTLAERRWLFGLPAV